MKNYLAIISGLLLSQAAIAATINKTLDLGNNGKIMIEMHNGSAEVIGWNKKQVKISGETDHDADVIVIEKDGNNVSVEENSRFGHDDKKTRLKIYVPHAVRVEAEGVNVDFSAKQINGGTSIETVNGSINAEECLEHIELESINGSITSAKLDGKIEIETINGEINDTGSSGRIELATVNGSINADSNAQYVEIESVNSTINLNLATVHQLEIHSTNARSNISIAKLADNGDVMVESVGGSITLSLPTTVKADFNLETQLSGSIRNSFSEHKAVKEKRRFAPNGSTLKLRANGGGADIRLSTLTGSIKLKKN